LNRRGGRIYIGIDDDRTVRGIKLTAKQRDTLKLDIQRITEQFEPKISNSEMVKIVFLPIKASHGKNEIIKGTFVAKIIVKQGDPKKLYSARRDVLEAYIRNDGQSKALEVREIYEMILARDKNPD